MRFLVVIGVLVLGLAVALLVMLRTEPPVVTPISTTPRPTIAPRIDAGAPTPILTHADAAHDALVPGESEAALARLHASGSGVESWDRQGLALLDSIAHDGVEIHDAGCYIAGCGASFTFASEAEYHRRIDELGGSELYRGWTGGKHLTGPEIHSDGRVTIALVLYRPD